MPSRRRRTWLAAGCSFVLASGLVSGCRTPGGVSKPPSVFIPEPEWPGMGEVFTERIASCADPERRPTDAERARCDREDYLEAYGLGVAAYAEELAGE